MTDRRLKLGMVGGGEGAFIGAVHRMAARLDDRWELVAGAFQSTPDRSIAFGRSLGLAGDRCYGTFDEMAKAEAQRPDRIDAVSIVTPNAAHASAAIAFMDAGIPVICDKPLTTNLQDAEDIAAAARRSGVPFILTHNYSGYPMIRHARSMIEAGELGAIRLIQAEYAQEWLARDLVGNKQAEWRGDPALAGPGGALGDIATHAFHLLEFVSGLRVSALAADLASFVPGRKIDDNANLILRLENGARGMLWASQVAIGSANGLRLRIFGESGGLEWFQETPDTLLFTPIGEHPQSIRRGSSNLSAQAARATRLPAGHPEGYLESFAQIYSEAAGLIQAYQANRAPDAFAMWTPGIADGVRGVKFIEAAVKSAGNNSTWQDI